MPSFENWLLLVTVVGVLLGVTGIFWARSRFSQRLILLGRVLFILSVILLGLHAFLAAVHCAEGLVFVSLTLGFLLLGMLWEVPRVQESQAHI